MAREHELESIRDQIDNEINGDAEILAKELFGAKKDMPDVGTASDAEAMQLMRQKYLANDREWLLAEAKRDPAQFSDLFNKLGGVTPPQQSPNGLAG